MSDRPRIKILTTGGTIDKIYFDAASRFEVGEPQVADLLHEAGVAFDFSVESVLRKDSLDLTEDDRRLIRTRVAADECERILITHGTDTMVETALRLLDVADKTIVLTGAMQPARLRISDAVFNIGYAVAALQILDPGVYIAMNGRLFDPKTARKNADDLRFENAV